MFHVVAAALENAGTSGRGTAQDPCAHSGIAVPAPLVAVMAFGAVFEHDALA